MSYTDRKITQAEINAHHVQGATDYLIGNPQQNKAVFDNLPEFIAGKFNDLIDEIAGQHGDEIRVAVDEWLAEHPEVTTTVQDNSLTTAKYVDGSVTEPKIAEGAVTPSKLDRAYSTPDDLASVNANLTNEINVLDARMDEFASLPEGSTTADAELLDIRVGADGKTYQTAGDAVREQVSDLKADIDSEGATPNLTWEQGSIVNGSNYSSSTRVRSASYIPISKCRINLNIVSGYSFSIEYYDATKVWKLDSGWINSSASIYCDGTYSFIRLMFRKTSNANITPSEVLSSGCNVKIFSTISHDVNSLKSDVDELAYLGQYKPITSWHSKTNPQVTNNGDGTFTVGTGDWGTIIFKQMYLIPGIYSLYGVPEGYSFLSTTDNYSTMFITNYDHVPKTIIINEPKNCYLGFRNDAQPIANFTIKPFCLLDRISDKAVTLGNDISNIQQILYKNINKENYWEVGGIGSNGENYSGRTTSIRTSVYFSISSLLKLSFEEGFAGGYIALYKDSGSFDGFLSRVEISSSITSVSKETLLLWNANATRFRIEFFEVSGNTSNYNLVQIISAQNIYSLDRYETKLQEAKMMLLHKTSSEGYGRCEFSAMVMSDIHNERLRTTKITELMELWGISNFDAFINCGDTVATTYSTDLTWYDNAVSNLGIPHINVVGNHDAWSSLGVLGDQATVYNKIVAPLADQTGIVQPADASINSLCYYYFDLGTGVRVIALDCMFWNADEAAWLETVLTDAKTNSKAVICVSHYGFSSSVTTHIPSLWREVDEAVTEYINIVAAQKVKDFIDAGGEFVCWLVGHMHGDNIHKLSDYGNQLILTFATPVQRASYIQKSDVSSDYNYTLATFLTVDKYYKTVRLLRIGADIDTWGIRHNGVSLNYHTGELIGAWS